MVSVEPKKNSSELYPMRKSHFANKIFVFGLITFEASTYDSNITWHGVLSSC